MLTRTLGGILRGRATPFQLAAACILGSLLGFVPGLFHSWGWIQAPALILTLLILLAVLNANLGLAALIAAATKLLSFAALPVSFQAGRLLLDGPTRPLFRALINAPVFAWFGLEYYTTTGGILLGLIIGAAAAVGVIRLVRAFRLRMSGIEERSAAYRKYSSKGWVRFLSWLLLGSGTGKLSYSEVAQKKVGNPIRWTGVAFSLLLVGLLVIVQLFLSSTIITAATRSGLEHVNGATVDVRSADLSLRKSRYTLEGLAIADPDHLENDIVRATRLEASISGHDLLRRRLTLDRVEVTDASSGEKRQVKGTLIRPRPETEPPKPPDDWSLPNGKQLEEYLKTAKEWKARLRQVRDWLDTVNKRRAEDTGEPGRPGAKETLSERLRRQARELGYQHVRAAHLVEGAPWLLIRETLVKGVRTSEEFGSVLDVTALNISTQPWLVPEAPRVTIRSQQQKLGLDLSLDSLAAAPKASTVNLWYKGLPADTIGRQLAVAGDPPIKGGTIDFASQGTLSLGSSIYIDLPIQATIRNSTISVPKAGALPLSAPISELTVPIAVRGNLESPMVLIDPDLLANALASSGAAELASRIRGEAESAAKKAAEAAEDAGKTIQKKLEDSAGGVIDDLFKKKEKKPDQPK